MTSTTQTIKQRIMEELTAAADGRGRTPYDAPSLARRLGLNGHDITKNLDQLRKEGRLDLGFKDSRIHTIAVRLGAPRRKGTNEQVWQWILSRGSYGAWVRTTPAQIKASLGLEGNAANVAVSDLLRQGRLEARRDGRLIEALRVPLAAMGEARRAVQTNEAREAVRETAQQVAEVVRAEAVEMPATPLLDAYVAARRLYRLAPTGNPFLRFEEDALAEEAVTVRDALRRALGMP